MSFYDSTCSPIVLQDADINQKPILDSRIKDTQVLGFGLRVYKLRGVVNGPVNHLDQIWPVYIEDNIQNYPTSDYKIEDQIIWDRVPV